MKNVYVVLDNDMENGTATTEAYSTYEKAEKAVKEMIQELKEQYEVIEKHDDGWAFIYDDTPERTIEIEADRVK